MNFFQKLKDTFEKIPIKTKFLKDLGFNNSYSGFRYFMQDRKETPSRKLMEKLCENMDYDYVVLPVKRDENTRALQEKIEETFFNDLNEYLKAYEGDQARVYVKNYGTESSVATAAEAFETDEHFDPNQRIDVSDLF